MAENKVDLICINCPMGCRLEVMLADGKVVSVANNRCIRGVKYATSELLNPLRTLTTTVRLRNSFIRALPVKSAKPLPKAVVVACAESLAGIEVEPPIRLNQVIVADIGKTGVDIVATRSID